VNKAGFNRRNFLTAGASAAAVAVAGSTTEAKAREIKGGEPWMPHQADAPDPLVSPTYVYFTKAEAAFVEAATERLIPHDELGPGAKDCNVALFIDHQLAGPYGRGGSWYMQGPWAKGEKTQGFQSRLAPADLYRAAIKGIEAHVSKAKGGKHFADLSPDDQDAVITDLEIGEMKLEGADAKTFFKMLLLNTKEGMFSDPIYGGNKDMAGWKMIGFPGARYNYLDWVDRHGQRYDQPPVGIRGRPGWDQQQG
jgi:gluconate 2-dehydrogenase gamma chain